MNKSMRYGCALVALTVIAIIFKNTLDAKCYQERCFARRAPVTVHDYTEIFNEKRYWLEINEDNGKTFICSQRLFLQPEFFRSPDMRCFPAQELQKSNAISNGKKCWYAEGIVLCDAGAKKYTVYPKTKKICDNNTPKNAVVLGHVKNTRRAREAGEPKMCTVIKVDKIAPAA